MLDQLKRLPAADIYEAAGKLGDMSPDIRRMVDAPNLAGPAYTVKMFPCETLAVLKAVDEAPAGSVLVIDAGDTERSTVWGGTTALAAHLRGIAGCITNGAVRDLAELQVLRAPLYARGVSIRGTVKSHPGWRQIPVVGGGVLVRAGDFVIADLGGIVVAPQERASEIAARAIEQRAKDEERERRSRAGASLSEVLDLQ